MTGSIEDGVHVVVGAGGGTGRVLVRELHAAGRRVRAVNRSGRRPAPPGVESSAGAVVAFADDTWMYGRASCSGRAWSPCSGPTCSRGAARRDGPLAGPPRPAAHAAVHRRLRPRTAHQFEMPFVVDGGRFARAFGAKPTPLDESVRTTLDWYRAHPARRSPGR